MNAWQPADEHKRRYLTYLASPAWQAKATAAKVRAGWRCQVCNTHRSQAPLDAHHL